MLLLNLRNFLFYPFFQIHFTLYVHLIDYTTSKVFVKNNANYFIQILRHHKLNCITKLLYQSGFVASMGHKPASSPLISPFLFHKQSGITTLPNQSSLEIELSNSIKIYGNKDAMVQIKYLVDK